MDKRPFVLIHSPLVGPLTWQFVGDILREQGYSVYIPELIDDPNSTLSFWQQEVNSVNLPITDPILVGHSGAGAILPAIGQKLNAHHYIFVDAVLLFNSATRMDLMYSEDPDFGQEFETFLQNGGQFPDWQDEHLQESIPDADLRQKLLSDVRPRPLEFFTEQIETTPSWPTQPCAYIQLSETYMPYTSQARTRNWPVFHYPSHHFAMLTNPLQITQLLIQATEQLAE